MRTGFRILAVMGLIAGASLWAYAADRDALWKITNSKCVPAQQVSNTPKPCESVDLTGGDAMGSVVLKDLIGATQFLLIPTRRITGMEDPLVGLAELPNYWRPAWEARQFVFQRAGKTLPPDTIGLAINAHGWRSQDQLHIHIDCLRADVRDILAQNASMITDTWSDLPVALAGQTYRVRRIVGEHPDPDPFALLLEDVKAAGTRLGDHTLAMVGAKDGFILLSRRGSPTERAHSEDVLDKSCALARLP